MSTTKKQPDSPVTTWINRWLSGDVKRLAAQLVVIVVTLWTLFGVQSTVDSMASEVDVLQRRVATLSRAAEKLGKVSRSVDDILETIDRATRLRAGSGGRPNR